MEIKKATKGFAALSQETRLQILRRLVQAGPEGVSAGDMSIMTKVTASTLSFHLKELSQSELILSERKGRTILYKANYEGLQNLIHFLMAECCQNNPDICAPFLAGPQK
ncbi:MAG: metalloregulator ArsR/SmtB family transcription factor [Pseudomonadota bacterium]